LDYTKPYTFISHLLSTGTSSGGCTQTLDLSGMMRVFYHCATAADQATGKLKNFFKETKKLAFKNIEILVKLSLFQLFKFKVKKTHLFG